MSELKIATPRDIRQTIDSLHEDIRFPCPTPKYPHGEKVVKWETLQTTDRLGYLGGFRISELVTRYHGEGNTSSTLEMEITEHFNTKEEVLIIRVNALKKKKEIVREIGLPLSEEYEPWSKPVWEAYEKNDYQNPCYLNRKYAWGGNRVLFDGLGYRVEGRQELKAGSDHILRHVRSTELRQLQLTPEERVSFFRWANTKNPLLSTYDPIEWFEYFPKFLQKNRL